MQFLSPCFTYLRSRWALPSGHRINKESFNGEHNEQIFFGTIQHSANGFEAVTDAAYHSVMDRERGEGREEEGEGRGIFFCAYLLRDI